MFVCVVCTDTGKQPFVVKNHDNDDPVVYSCVRAVEDEFPNGKPKNTVVWAFNYMTGESERVF